MSNNSSFLSAIFAVYDVQFGHDALVAAMTAYIAASGGSSSTPVQVTSTTPVQSTPAPKAGRAKKTKAPDAPKKPLNDWIKFTAHVREVVTAAATDGKKPLPKGITQTASALKEAGLMGSATDDQVLAAYANWVANPPAVSKQAAAGKTKSKKGSVGSSSSTSSVAKMLDFTEPAPAPAPAPTVVATKTRKPRTDEQKAAAAAKRAATKAAKSATTLTASATPLPPAEVDVMDFTEFLYKKMSLLKNSRGDVLTPDLEWFGRYDAKTNTLDTAVPKPSDLDL